MRGSTVNENKCPAVPLACNTSAFNAEQQKRYQALIAALHLCVEAVKELPDGYAFRFPSEAAMCQDVMEFATLERLCCPFLVFQLTLAPAQGPVTLSLTGPIGVKEIIAEFLWCTPTF
jgi:hypothetical protein